MEQSIRGRLMSPSQKAERGREGIKGRTAHQLAILVDAAPSRREKVDDLPLARADGVVQRGAIPPILAVDLAAIHHQPLDDEVVALWGGGRTQRSKRQSVRASGSSTRFKLTK